MKKFILLIKEIAKALLPYGFVKFLQDSNFSIYWQSKKIFRKYYLPKYYNSMPSPTSGNKTCKKMIYIADGRISAGGLADRLAGMVSLYELSKELNVDFKIYMTSPVNLLNYLIPNQHNWIINDHEIIYDIRESVIYNFKSSKGGNWIGEIQVLKRLQSLFEKWNQIHITTNIDTPNKAYGELYNELFKPTNELKNRIDCSLQEIGCDFISATFRFQKLLGDFSDGENPTLPHAQRVNLINRCVSHIVEIYKENNYKKILVTSDSITFLNEAKKIDFVYIIPGVITHVDNKTIEDKEIYMKSFLDYYLLTHSKLVYLVIDGDMYRSGFSYRAALHNFPYKIKKYTDDNSN
jgi:hypothetical protein